VLGCTILFFQIPLNMEAKELRIGNFVSDKINRCISIQEVRQDHYVFTLANGSKIKYHINSAKPIPLTEDWLLKFGFKSVSLGEYQLGSILLDNEYTDKGVFNISDGDHCLSSNVLYVHQLQNLYFALKQQELLLTT